MTLHEALNILEEIALGDKEREAYEKVREVIGWYDDDRFPAAVENLRKRLKKDPFKENS